MGYLVGFLVAAFFTGFLKFDNWIQKPDASLKAFLVNFIKLLISVATIYLLGILWLSKFVGWDKVLLFGLKPFGTVIVSGTNAGNKSRGFPLFPLKKCMILLNKFM